jgi:hypothetical protein
LKGQSWVVARDHSNAVVSSGSHDPLISDAVVDFTTQNEVVAHKLKVVAPFSIFLCMVMGRLEITDIVREAKLSRESNLYITTLSGESDRTAHADNCSQHGLFDGGTRWQMRFLESPPVARKGRRILDRRYAFGAAAFTSALAPAA